MWFAEGSPHNISTRVRGKQTGNRGELTAVILAVRKSLSVMDPLQTLVVFSDSKLCVDGINKWLQRWKEDGWTREGRPLKNADLWRVMDRAITAMNNANIQFAFRHVPAHVGIYGNEKADRLANAAVRSAHRAVPQTAEEAQDILLDRLADDIVFACLSRM